MSRVIIAVAGPQHTRTGSVTTITMRDIGGETINLTAWTTQDVDTVAMEKLLRVGKVVDVVGPAVQAKTGCHAESLAPITSSSNKLKFIPRPEFRTLKLPENIYDFLLLSNFFLNR